ncbi:serine/threonine-protein kinase [Streptomyces millisiae]|uniref:Serine/threonine-protein kinase n=1 Tax=Streptomyces millisiae TaxID=3075542 RepID=A0ABU2LHJ8_9ACTN|nr:serine/threonine-protein kinase [Streptomyces sp. DSM 44918]MDT0317064.1 serine/threonine-protein kinase [Streptomyces sp. DSM 44918]
MPAPLNAEDPTTIAGYRLTARLGEGGMGKVYLSHTPGGRPIALKVIRPEVAGDPEFRRRFRQEVQAAERVQGLYTAPVIDSDTDGPQPWLATAYVPGPSLHNAIREHGPLPLQAAARVVAGIAEALQVIHAAGVIHRDLKPSNVLLASDGPRVIDFGIARAADATSLTRTGVTAGTPAFMAPEQAMAQPVTPAADIFALGLIAVFTTAGSPPFGDGSSPAVLYRIVHEQPDISAVPTELRELVTRCLAKNPADRPTPAEVVAMCRPLAGDATLPAHGWLPPALSAEIDHHAATVTSLAAQPAPPPAAFHATAPTTPPYTPAPPPRRRGRNALLAALAVCAVVAGAVIGATLLNGGNDENPTNNDAAGDETSQTPTDQETTPAEEETETTPSEPTSEPPAEPEPVTYEDLSISDYYVISLWEDPPRPVRAEAGPGYEGDLGYSGSDFILEPRLLTSGDNTLALLRQDETGSLDTCRSVTRYTDVLVIEEEAPPGSEICLTTTAGDIGLITVKDYTTEYVTIDLTVWRGGAQ